MTTGPHDNDPLPAAPPVRPTERATAPRPKTITYSFALWMVVSALNVLNLIGAFVIDRADLEREVAAANTGLTPEMIDQAVTVTVVTAFAIPIVFLVVILVGAFQMLKGRNWARIVLTIFGGLLVLLSLLNAAVASPLVGIIVAVVIAAAIVLMYVADSAAFFSARKASY